MDVNGQLLSHVQLFVASWTIVHWAPLSIEFSNQEYWSRLSCPFPEDLPDPGIKPAFLKSPALAGGFFTTSATWDALRQVRRSKISDAQTANKICPLLKNHQPLIQTHLPYDFHVFISCFYPDDPHFKCRLNLAFSTENISVGPLGAVLSADPVLLTC